MAKLKSDHRNSPLYTQKEASAYLALAPSTLRYWAFGEHTNRRNVSALIETSTRQLSFLNLVELHVLSSLRAEHNIDIQTIRKALLFVTKKLKVPRPLLEQSFETDGVNLFVEHYGSLINVNAEGQHAMRELLTSSLKRVERDSHKIPLKLFPYTRTELNLSPKIISMTPSLCSGRPVIDGTGISTAVLAERLKAGDSTAELADDYNQPVDAIEEAIRCELRLAA